MKQVIVIGAGPAGLTAAYELLKRGGNEYNVTVLEESYAIGGISRTVEHHGNRMDIGGHRFFSKDKRVREFWENLMPMQGALSYDDKVLGREKKLSENGPDPEKEDRVMLLRRRISRIYYMKKFFDYPISMKKQTFVNMGLEKTLRSGCSYMKSTVKKLPEVNLENFYINRFGKQLYSMFFEGYTEKLWGRHPREISAAWGAQRVKGLSILAILKDMAVKVAHVTPKKVETSLIEEFSYPKCGPGQLWETLAGEVEKLGGTICFGHAVKEVVLADEGRSVCRVLGIVRPKEAFEDGVAEEEAAVSEFSLPADLVFSTMPVRDLVAGMKGEVPENVREVAAGLPYRDYVTVGLLVDQLHLKNETDIPTLGNIVPDCWIYVQDTDVKLGRIQIYNNWSPYMVEDPEHRVWIGLEYFCDEGDDFWNMSREETIRLAIKELVKMGILSEECHVYDAHREKVKKAYPAYFDTYDRIGELEDYLKSFDNLFCLGRNGQHRYNNMDHSMVTAMEAVDNILSGISDQTNIWSVNTEKEYHENDQSQEEAPVSDSREEEQG